MICNYCSQEAKRVTGKETYPHRPDLFHKIIYECKPCDASVGCHPGTDKPLGSLANRKLRSKRRAAHAVFDPLWKSGRMPRQRAYQWLADLLEIHRTKCHIGMFDEETCQLVINFCKQDAATSIAERGQA